MKQTAQNQFNDGLNLDLHPIVTPNSVLTDNINGTFITYNGNEFCLQNDKGNIFKAALSYGFTPIGIKEHNGVLYIVSYNKSTNEGEIGTYPGLDWDGWDQEHTEQEESFNYELYTPLGNCKSIGSETPVMRTEYFNFDLEHPVSIEVQDSYDGSVNLILTDDKNEPRLINSGFSVLPDGKYKFPKRVDNKNNSYSLNNTFNSQIRLVKNSTAFTHIDLGAVEEGGELKGGNYTFYLKYGDDDENMTDIVCQSGVIAIYKGVAKNNTSGNNWNGVRGTLMDELTTKSIKLVINNLDKNYSKFYLYYTREYSDTNGYSMSEAKFLSNPYSYNPKYYSIEITVSGIEPEASISEEDLNIAYHTIDEAKTITQQSDMLFVGNISKSEEKYDALKQLSLDGVLIRLIDGPAVSLPAYNVTSSDLGYANPNDLYYNLGYWPNEYYRLGIVYIKDDGSLTSVYNIKGTENLTKTRVFEETDNEYGIFKFSDDYQFSNNITPKGFSVTILDAQKEALKLRGIIGYFIVRQKRHPITLCQGIAIPVNQNIGIPLIPRKKVGAGNEDCMDRLPINYTMMGVTQSFLTQDFYYNNSNEREWAWGLGNLIPPMEDDRISESDFKWMCNHPSGTSSFKNSHMFTDFSNKPGGHLSFAMRGIVSADPILVPDIRNKLNDKFSVKPLKKLDYGFRPHGTSEGIYHYMYDVPNEWLSNPSSYYGSPDIKLTYVDSNTKSKVIDGKPFCTVVGNASSVSDFGVIYSTSIDLGKSDTNIDYPEDIRNYALVRGNFMPFIAAGDLEDKEVGESIICNICRKELSNELDTLKNDQSPFYAISNREYIDNNSEVFRGDCYVCRVWLRYNWNFVGSEPPANMLMKSDWTKIGFKRTDIGKTFDQADWTQVNLADLNNVPLGLWLSFVCYSNYNLQIRSNDSSDTYMTSFMGSERSFFPYKDISVLNEYKQEESHLLNAGYSTTVGRIRYQAPSTIPYVKNEFSNRIIFSNKHVTDAFANGYRTFQGLSYKDYDKQYGEIVKLLPWKESLFCVMEHGLALIPVNEKALIQTTTDQTIHIYGHGVLPDNITLISADYGSKYANTVIKTPIGIYGLDTSARKVWRFSEKQGFETLSDMKIESFLNEYLKPEYVINIGKEDVRTHYNSTKGDLLFTWYITTTEPEQKFEAHSICFNERQGIWTTKYSWVPEVSENVDGTFFSLQKGEDSNDSVGVYSHDVKEASPTKWYGKQHPFEFEFVVSDPIGAHKIYENLQIISNNVQPEELQFEFIGDAYMFNKARIYHTVYEKPNFASSRIYKNETAEVYYVENPTKDPNEYSKPNVEAYQKLGYKPFRNASKLNDRNVTIFGEIIKTDNATEQYHLRIPQECRNMETWGRRLGNIHYKNDSWFTTIEPIIYDAKLNDPNIVNLDNDEVKWQSARIRDKWCKIRVRYSGEDLAVITAIKTIINI